MFEYLCIVFNAILLVFCLMLSREVRAVRRKAEGLESGMQALTRERKEADEKEAKLFEGIKNIFDYSEDTARKAVKNYGDED